MKTIYLFVIIVCAGFTVRAQIPDVDVQNIDKKWVTLSDLKGEKLTVVDFWATWCKPCVTSIPKLNKLYSEFSEKGVEFIGVNTDGPRNLAKVKPFATSMDIKYPVVLDPDQELVNRFNVKAFPTLIILDKNWDEIFIHEGFSPGDEQLISEELIKILANAK